MHDLTQFSILILETVGVIIILCAGLRGVFEYLRKKPGAQLRMVSSMAFALEFKLGGEILRTVLVRELSEIFIVGCIIALRGILNYLIHRDIHEHRLQEGLEDADVPQVSFLKALFGRRPAVEEDPKEGE